MHSLRNLCRSGDYITQTGIGYVIHGIDPVTAVGLTSLADDVFVLRYKKPQVRVYDAVTFTLQRHLSVPGLRFSVGMAACASNKCLYACNYNKSSK